MEGIYYVGVLLLAGLIFSRLLAKLKFPDVTGYLIGGIIVGPSLLGLIPASAFDSLGIISQVALAFIAFSIGNEMEFSTLKRLGSGVIVLVLFEALFAFGAVTLSMLLIFKTNLAFALTIGSIACATAPAATLMVIKQYDAKGPLVNTLIPVVALDDVVCIIAFGIASSISLSLINHSQISIARMIFNPLKEIFLAILIGFLAGLAFSYLIKKVKNDNESIAFTVGAIFLVTASALYFNLSSLLTLMVMGITASNLGSSNRRYESLISNIIPPITISFFVLSGAELDFASLKSVGAMGLVYIIARVIGKITGAYLGSRLANYPKEVQKYLGLTLLPQAGVAIGLSLIASKMLADPYGNMIRSIILGATIVYELVGPLVAKTALIKSGSIKQ